MSRSPFLLIAKPAGRTEVVCTSEQFRMAVYELPVERLQAGSDDLVMYGSAGSQLYGFVYQNWDADKVETLFPQAITWYAQSQVGTPLELSMNVPGKVIIRQLQR